MTTPNYFLAQDFVVADLFFRWGRKEIKNRETEIPGLMAVREEFRTIEVRARITGSLYMTIQTAVLIETLNVLAQWCAGHHATSTPHKITQRLRLLLAGTPVFAFKGENLMNTGNSPHFRMDRRWLLQHDFG